MPRILAAALAVASLAACQGDRVLPSAEDDAETPGAGAPDGSEEEAAEPGPGADGVGDAYYPQLGNGGYDVLRYDLDIVFNTAERSIDATATIEARATQALDRFNLDLTGLEVESLDVHGVAATFDHQGHELVVSPSEPIDEGHDFLVRVVYGGVPEPVASESLGQVGWTTSEDGDVFVLSQPEGASTWYPVNDHPIDKARLTRRVTVPEGVEVAANGRLGAADVTVWRSPSCRCGSSKWPRRWRPIWPPSSSVTSSSRSARGPAGVTVRHVFARRLAKTPCSTSAAPPR